jgi:hypothetical protein
MCSVHESMHTAASANLSLALCWRDSEAALGARLLSCTVHPMLLQWQLLPLMSSLAPTVSPQMLA